MQHFSVSMPMKIIPPETFPGYLAPIIRLSEDESKEREVVSACFGMVPHWADLKLARQSYNARTETVAQKPSFRNAYRKRQFCIIPADAFCEPNYETGKAVRWKISHVDGRPLGLAGIWDWRPNGGPDDQPLVSFSMLTINADDHPLLRRFHKANEEKRMVVILEPHDYEEWLHAPGELVPSYFKQYSADQLVAEAAPILRKLKTGEGAD
jgi:putative SOS response-associated peptidase YedK